MNDTERANVLEFVAANRRSYLLSRRSDGFPTAWAMTARAGDDAIEFSTYRTSAKAKILRREGTAGVVIAAMDPDDGRVLVAHGPVEFVEAAHWSVRAEDDSRAETDDALVPEEIRAKVAARHDSGKRVVVRVLLNHAHFETKPGTVA